MEHLIDDPSKRARLRSQGQKAAGHRRVKYLVRTKRGRPIKESGIYYCKHVLVDNETYEYIINNKFTHQEPLGSVVHRLILQNRKKEEAENSALFAEQPLDSETYKALWATLDTKQ
jgi:hypothetical protein